MRIRFFIMGAVALCAVPPASAAQLGVVACRVPHASDSAETGFAGVASAVVARAKSPGIWLVEQGTESPESGTDVGKAAPDGLTSSARAFVDDLFHRLQASSDPQEARGIAGVIERFWLHSGSDTADLLMERAIAAMQTKQFDLALTLLSRIIELEPDWAEAWNKRATLRFELDDLNGSMQDIQKVLSLEPRHFGALSGMAMILQREGLDKRALQAFRRLLDVYPTMESIRDIVDKLAIQVEGRGI
jgi:tetratricopeptide (TPR) repeat protein